MSKQTNQAEPVTGKIRYSINHKLNTKLFLRLVAVFFSLNIMICIITVCSLTVYCERAAADAFTELYESGQPELIGGGVIARRLPEYSASFGYDLGKPISGLLPYETRSAGRMLRAEEFRAGIFNIEDAISDIEYIVTVRRDADYVISMSIGPVLLYFIYAFAVLLIFEFLTIISRSFKDRRMVRKVLDPITELARAANSLKNVGRQLEHDKVMALAGRLDGIDVSKLDTRIQVDDLQQELKNVAVAINGMLDRITEAYATQARFVSDASHELRTPIAVIQGYANLLDRWGKEDEKTLTESISAIKDEAGNMKELVEQLLFLARGDSNTIRLEEERVSLPELIGEVVSETQMLDSGHEFKLKADEVTVTVDRSLIKQALRILVDNAVKYTDNGGEITVAAKLEGGAAKLSVTDNGVGISPEIIPYVFDRFVRADESRARATGGAGLGLSIAQWIAARHNGHMEVLSREGVGTRVTIVLPVKDYRNEPQSASAHLIPSTAADIIPPA